MAQHSWHTSTESPPRHCSAVVIEEPGSIALRELALSNPSPDDVVVRVAYSGVSTGTEKLLYSGAMPPFPGMGYPLVPGYESVGEVVWAGAEAARAPGEHVFVPGANCFEEAHGLFGATASTLVVAGARTVPLPRGESAECQASPEPEGLLLALAATAQHALSVCQRGGGELPSLIVGHGVLGRLLARLTLANGAATAPVVWEASTGRHAGAEGYAVLTPEDDPHRDYASVVDASGDPAVLDQIMPRLARGGRITLAGFYSDPVRFTFPPAFMREAAIAVAAEWQPEDLAAVREHLAAGRLNLSGLISHTLPATQAATAYPRAFEDPECLKLVLDWSAS